MRLLGKNSSKPTIELCTVFVRTGKRVLTEHTELTGVAYSLAELALSDQERVTKIEEADTIADDLTHKIEGIYHKGGCQVEFQVGQEAVRAVCAARECPFYPNGPDRIQ